MSLWGFIAYFEEFVMERYTWRLFEARHWGFDIGHIPLFMESYHSLGYSLLDVCTCGITTCYFMYCWFVSGRYCFFTPP